MLELGEGTAGLSAQLFATKIISKGLKELVRKGGWG